MNTKRKENVIMNTISAPVFSSIYPTINCELIHNGDFVNSRNGSTRELFDFKTEITDPYKRCSGNNKRGMNIFFLMAEALWIWAGRKDVNFLDKFNSQMINYSDDGKYFHAPYGFRMRHHGLSSWDGLKTREDSNKHDIEFFNGKDQIEESLKMLEKDSESRRVVMQIWDANLDLGVNSKDLPCNDMVFLKIRDGKLRTTIANRSNDLHWGLPTNVFQFSFVTEIMAQILGVTLGTQTHNSQSLHFYIDNPIAFNMQDEFIINDGQFEDIYDNHKELRMNFNFSAERNAEARLREVDYWVNGMIYNLQSLNRHAFSKELRMFDEHLYRVYKMLSIYLDYKESADTSDARRLACIKEIEDISSDEKLIDIEVMGINFFSSKLKDTSMVEKYVYNF